VGLLYWYVVLPLHGVVFRGMLDGIERASCEPADTFEPQAKPVS
jgi:hypothetical protein